MDDATRIIRNAQNDELAKRLSAAGKVQTLVEERDHLRRQVEALTTALSARLTNYDPCREVLADAERLAEALQMARGFLGFGIKGNPMSTAWVADEALRQHEALSPSSPEALKGEQG